MHPTVARAQTRLLSSAKYHSYKVVGFGNTYQAIQAAFARPWADPAAMSTPLGHAAPSGGQASPSALFSTPAHAVRFIRYDGVLSRFCGVP